jgi:hypothetical protein
MTMAEEATDAATRRRARDTRAITKAIAMMDGQTMEAKNKNARAISERGAKN